MSGASFDLLVWAILGLSAVVVLLLTLVGVLISLIRSRRNTRPEDPYLIQDLKRLTLMCQDAAATKESILRVRESFEHHFLDLPKSEAGETVNLDPHLKLMDLIASHPATSKEAAVALQKKMVEHNPAHKKAIVQHMDVVLKNK